MTDIDDDPRRMLDRLLTEKGGDYAQLSARIGRNPAYIQQYIKRGGAEGRAGATRRRAYAARARPRPRAGAKAGDRRFRGAGRERRWRSCGK